MRLISFVVLLIALAVPATAERVTVFAAASLRGVLEDIAAGFDGEVTLSFGGSGTLARQVSAGAPADVIALASPLWMDWLTEQGLIGTDAARTVARNSLVVIGPARAAPLATPENLLPRLDGGRLAMGQRDAVPAGAYAQAWLRASGLWPEVHDQLAETDNVRAALALVARGEVPLGVVYATDATAEPRVSVVFEVPQASSGPIVYPAAAITPKGKPFLEHLTSPAAQALFAAHGFRAP